MIEITKSKNISSSDSLQNRLLRLEKILQQLVQSLGKNGQFNLPDINTLIANNVQSNLFTLINHPKEDNINQVTVTAINSVINRQKTSKNNLLLSNGQMVAELALAIARASQRNS